jgi:hypothetical protein
MADGALHKPGQQASTLFTALADQEVLMLAQMMPR